MPIMNLIGDPIVSLLVVGLAVLVITIVTAPLTTELLGIGWLVFNVAFVIPAAFILFYTANSVFPLLASVEDLDAPIYRAIDLGRVIDEEEDGSSLQQNKTDPRPRAVTFSIRSMYRLLLSSRTSWKLLSLFRGVGWLLLWNLVKGVLLLLVVIKLSSVVGLMAQVLLPLALIQLHMLWVHTAITSPSPKPFNQRIIPAREAFKVAGLPMFLVLTVEAIAQRIAFKALRHLELKFEDFFPMLPSGNQFEKSIGFWLLIAVLVFVFIAPAHLLLVRIEASLLPSDERTIIPLDPAISSEDGSGHMNLIDGWKSLTRVTVTNLIFLYLKIFSLTAVVAGIVGFTDFAWYIGVAMQYWRF